MLVYPPIGILFLTIRHVWAQLSLVGDKIWLENINLYISEYIIDEIGHSVGSFSSHHSDAADKLAVHRPQ